MWARGPATLRKVFQRNDTQKHLLFEVNQEWARMWARMLEKLFTTNYK